MSPILEILIFLVLGFVFGFVIARIMSTVSKFFLSRKMGKEILRKDLSEEELRRRNFYFKDKPYNLKEQVEFERNKRKKFNFFKIFKKRQKEVSQYGDTIQSGNINTIRGEQVFGGVKDRITAPTSPSNPTINPPTAPREQIRLNSPESGGERRNFNRNLFEKGK